MDTNIERQFFEVCPSIFAVPRVGPLTAMLFAMTGVAGRYQPLNRFSPDIPPRITLVMNLVFSAATINVAMAISF
jgi:hypothetical protein